ncbi:MAG: hypothetical protein JSW10_05255 [Pseudomonadota bacterium]|nr:MAG: hypothetical protein JSW10_05255 [Pseudomonadota bacterium]
MANQGEQGTEDIREAARKAVERGADITQQMHDITLQALTEGEIKPERVREVTRSVFEGVREAAPAQPEQLRKIWGETVEGIDQALRKAAEASNLAMQEAAGRLHDFSENDLKRAMDDMAQLEDMFLDTVKQFAANTSEVNREILDDLVAHSRRSGTAVGQQTAEALEKLRVQFEQAGTESMKAGVAAARTAGASIAQMAAGMLAGIADAMAPGAGEKTDEKGDEKD